MNRNKGLKVLILLLVILISFSNGTFASDIEDFKILGYSLDYFVSVLGWLWVFFAKLAGTFLTNQWVYGEALGLDALLWKIWNLMKNIANFGLGFYFVYTIFKGLIKKNSEDITRRLKDVVLWLLIAGVGIQASWFFTAAIIDVSTVTLVAAGSFPYQIISEISDDEIDIKGAIRDSIKSKQISLFSKDSKASSFLESAGMTVDKTKSDDEIIDIMMPNEKDVAGPLYFIGFSILKTDVLTSVNKSNVKGLKGTIYNVLIQGGTTVVFAIEMLVLCILALMRIIYLWIFIVLSPLAVLLWCIENSRKKDSGGSGKGFLSKFTNEINFRSFFINVFKPTFIVLAFGLAAIFVALMNRIVLDYSSGTFDLQGTKVDSVCEDNVNGNEGDKNCTTMIDNNFLSFTLVHVGKTLLEVVLCVITVMIVYLIVSIAVKMGGGKDFVSAKISNIQDSVKGAIESAPVLPVVGYDDKGVETTRYISARRVFGLGGANSLLEEKINSYQGKLLDKYNDQTSIINSWFGGSSFKALQSSDRSKIEAKWAGNRGLGILEEQKKVIYELRDQNLKSGEGYGMILSPTASDKFWIGQFEKWLTDMKDRKNEITGINSQYWKEMVERWNDDKNKDSRSLQNLFQKNTYYVKAYADLFGLNGVTSWSDLKDVDISKKE